MRGWFSGRRRQIATLIVGVAVGMIIVSPASANVVPSFSHLWGKHIKPAVLSLVYTKTQLSKAGSINASRNPVNWSKLKGVPGELADGTDDGWEVGAVGTVKEDATAAWGNNLFSGWSSQSAGTGSYRINIGGEVYTWSQYTTVVTPACGAAGSWQATDDAAGRLLVKFWDRTGDAMACAFQFVTF